MSGYDRDLLEAFLPEFQAEAAQLAGAGEATAGRVLDRLRALAGALGSPSLLRLAEAARAALDPHDPAALAEAAAALAAQAEAIAAAGAEPAATAAVGAEPAATAAGGAEPAATAAGGAVPASVPAPAPTEALDPELLAAFAPEFEAACARLAAAATPEAAAKALDGLRALAGAAGIGSLRAMLAAAPEPDDLPALARLAAALGAQAARVLRAGADLPAAPEVPPPATPAATPPPAAPRRRVLVVDDSAMMRRLVREIVAADPALEVVGEAPDGRAALAAMAALRPDLTLLDIEMPELDGIGVLRRWSLRGGGAVVVVSSAARPGSATALEALRLGAAAIVAKPSGALSPDLAERQGAALRRAARRAVGLPGEMPA